MKTITCKKTLSVTNHPVLIKNLNDHNTLYGGDILNLIDSNASISATRFCLGKVVTASINSLNFLKPFILKNSFCIISYVSGSGNKSIEVFTKVIGEELNGRRFLGLTAFLTFVAQDSNLPSIAPETSEEKLICSNYKIRKNQIKNNFLNVQDVSTKYPWE